MSAGALNGTLLTHAALTIRRWGAWSADVRVDSAETFAGQVTLELGGLTLQGTVVDGGVDHQTGWWRLVGGQGGWRTAIPRKGYRNAAGVKLSTVLQDAAAACGEPIGTVPPTQIGPAFSRPEAEASRVLDLLTEEAWYVDQQGTTQIGTRPPVVFSGAYVVTARAPSGLLLTVAAEDISALLPGATLEDIEVASVRHELTPAGLRSHLFALTDEGTTDDLDGAMKDVVLSMTAHMIYFARFEYRVTKWTDGYVDLRPVRTKLGLPDLANVPMRVGLPGGGGEPAVGSTALVSFIDGDPTQPFVDAYVGQSGAGYLPVTTFADASTEAQLGKGAAVVKLSTGEQFVALENLVKAELQAQRTYVAAHVHTSSAPGDPTTAPTVPPPPVGDVKAAKVKAT